MCEKNTFFKISEEVEVNSIVVNIEGGEKKVKQKSKDGGGQSMKRAIKV